MAARGKRSGNETDERSIKQGPAPDPTTALRAALEIFSEGADGEQDWKKLNLHGKIAAISGHLGRIPKNGHNNFNNYDYVLESDLVEAVRYLLAAARILIFPEAFREHTVFTFEGQSREGRPRDILTDSIVVYRVVDGYSGESFTFEVNAQGSDPRDKGANKASTSAMKFAYMRLFNISSGEDAEGDDAGDARAAGAPNDRPNVTVTTSSAEGAQRGGHQEKASGAQIRVISQLSNQLGLGGPGLTAVIQNVLGDAIELPQAEGEHSKAIAGYLKEQSGERAGQLVAALQQMATAASGSDDDGEPV